VRPGRVAGGVRARLLLERRAGADVVSALAGAASLAGALDSLRLSRSAYARNVPAEPTLAEAQRAVAQSVLVACRTLAAWLQRDAVARLRALGSWFELANLEDRVAYLEGAELRPAFELGMLTSAWSAASETGSVSELRRLLERSAWGAIRADDPRGLQLELRLSWARRVATQVPVAHAWAAGAAAIVLAAEMFACDRRPDPADVRGLGLGDAWASAATVTELCASLPQRAGWALEGIGAPAELWRAEPRWWQQVGRDAEAMVHRRLDDEGVVEGAVALLALDAVRVNAALAVADRSQAPGAREVLDALL
jgi:hypothetical protein